MRYDAKYVYMLYINIDPRHSLCDDEVFYIVWATLKMSKSSIHLSETLPFAFVRRTTNGHQYLYNTQGVSINTIGGCLYFHTTKRRRVNRVKFVKYTPINGISIYGYMLSSWQYIRREFKIKTRTE